MDATSPRLQRAIREEYVDRNRRSEEYYARANMVFPGGSTRNTIYFDPFPPIMRDGVGCYVEDVDGNRRVDFLNNYTALILGHAPSRIVERVTEVLARGSAFGAPTENEIVLAEAIRQRVESVDLIRFTTTGTEATMAALRTARAFTGRAHVGVFEGCYHGTHDYVASPGPGIPPEVGRLSVWMQFNDPDGVSRIVEENHSDMAAIIVEPVMGAAGIIPAERDFLVRLRELTDKYGIVLIFDEIMVFRIHERGAQGHYGVRPDLTTFAKIIGGGFPNAAFGGRGDIMALHNPRSGTLALGGTYNANPVACAAGAATLESLGAGEFDHLNALGLEVRERLNQLFQQRNIGAQVTGIGSLFNIHGTRSPIANPAHARESGSGEFVRLLVLALMNEGYYLAPRGLGCLSIPMGTAEIDGLVNAVDRVLDRLAAES